MMNDKFINGFVRIVKKTRVNVSVKVDGNSMYPFLYNGDLVNVTKAESYQIGDIIVYRNRITVIHRIIDIRLLSNTKKVYIAKGDNNLLCDPPVLERCIIGKVTGIFRDGKAYVIKKDIFQKGLTFLSKNRSPQTRMNKFTLCTNRIIEECQKLVAWAFRLCCKSN